MVRPLDDHLNDPLSSFLFSRCERGYLGLRCAHSELVKQPLNEEYLALIVFLTSMLLLVTVLAVFFALKW